MRKLILTLSAFCAVLTSAGLAAAQYSRVEGDLPVVLGQGAKDSILHAIIRPVIAYPEKAVSPVVQAVVWLRVTVGEQGKALKAEVVDCSLADYGFEQAALNAIESAAFLPLWKGLYSASYTGYYPIPFIDPSRQRPIRGLNFLPKNHIEGPGLDCPELAPSTVTVPTYPAKAMQKLVEGVVILRVLVTEKGSVATTSVFHCSAKDVGFERSAAEVIKKSTYPIKMVNGRPSKYTVYSQINFSLSDDQLAAAGLPRSTDSTVADQEPKLLMERRLVYPSEAVDKEIEGTVWMAVLVDKIGRVVTARIDTTSGSVLLDSTALHLVRKEQYKPALAGGNAVARWTRFPIDYFYKSVPRHLRSKTGKGDSYANMSIDFGDSPQRKAATVAEIAPKFIKYEKAVYPQKEWDAGVTGNVKIGALVDEDGSLIETKIFVSSDNAALDSAATAACKGHRIQPGTTKGKPVCAWMLWNVDFSHESKGVLPPSGEAPIDIEGPQLISGNLRASLTGSASSGKVGLTYFVGTDGEVDSIEVITSSGNREMDQSAVNMVRSYKYKPAKKNGQPVGFRVKTTITFEEKK